MLGFARWLAAVAVVVLLLATMVSELSLVGWASGPPGDSRVEAALHKGSLRVSVDRGGPNGRSGVWLDEGWSLIIRSHTHWTARRWFPVVRHSAAMKLTNVVIPLWLPLLAALAAGAMMGRPRFRSRAPGLCPHCGYNIQGLSGATCPECGRVAPEGGTFRGRA